MCWKVVRNKVHLVLRIPLNKENQRVSAVGRASARVLRESVPCLKTSPRLCNVGCVLRKPSAWSCCEYHVEVLYLPADSSR
jgi:hypothetical protein